MLHMSPGKEDKIQYQKDVNLISKRPAWARQFGIRAED